MLKQCSGLNDDERRDKVSRRWIKSGAEKVGEQISHRVHMNTAIESMSPAETIQKDELNFGEFNELAEIGGRMRCQRLRGVHDSIAN